ncbi:GGDEF domain-containing phosphodiesterase [Sedimentibacter sp.]|uniref:GGDEF domain-containing phosphodiesterase n=1 Tax=Sedimentibacter sp. TaxID=1960295 RepID=UPI00289AFE48|nr:GGDEF domain-containing phosphodiesterase [Sedimentibacter sp.]
MYKKLAEFVENIIKKDNIVVWMSFVALQIAVITYLVYITGGASSVVQMLYIPILIIVIKFGIRYGIAIAVIAGLAVGPFMPYAATNTMQPTSLWVLRIIISIVIVFIVGKLSEKLNKFNELEKKKAYEDIATGYHNLNKLKVDLNREISSKKYLNISIISFKFENMDMIRQYVDFEVGDKSYIRLHEIAGEFFCNKCVYSAYGNKIVIMLPGYNINEAYNLAKKFIQETKNPIYIDDLPISPVVKAGIVNYPLHETDVDNIIVMLDKSLKLSDMTHNDVMIYDDMAEKEKDRYYQDLVSLYHALKGNMFKMHYQPIVNVRTNQVVSVEALLKWNDTNHNNMSIAELIKIAEDAGFINEITKWVIKNVIDQIKIWNDKGIEIPVSINVSARDLSDETFIDYVKDCISSNNIKPKNIQFELTERSIINDGETAAKTLKSLKHMGIKISLDDYGTGYNSLKNLVDFADKFDYLKIDKIFIDKIIKDEKLIIVDYIISAAHRLGIKVVAEGVEMTEQIEILKIVDCDMIQGFYYSKPLPPEELEEYVSQSEKSS